MAASLCFRGTRLHHCDRIFRTFLRQSYFAFSTDNKGSEPSDSSRNDANENSNPDSERKLETSTQQPVLDTHNTGFKSSSSSMEGALNKFAKVIDKVKAVENLPEKTADVPDDPNESFATMFRKSKFVSLGEHQGRRIEGRIIEVMENDLYIDFGGKFHCVCQRPQRNADKYVRGTKVALSLQAMEMSSAFLGSHIHVTLLEADAVLLGLSNVGNQQRDIPATL